MYYLLWGILFLVYAILPFGWQIIIFIVSCFVAPGGNLALILAMIVGVFLKRKMR